GQDTTYNYASLFAYLGHHYDVSRNNGMLSDVALQNVDVLLLKVPTTRYSDQEVEAVCKWTRRGGGLMLVGDHTNVFGSSEYLNEISSRFGITFNYDA